MNSSKKRSGKKNITRRQFIATTGAGTAAFFIVPRAVLGGPGYVAPSDKLNIACVGVGGKGRSDIAAVSTENIIALCDVDDRQMKATLAAAMQRDPDYAARLQQAKKYRDFREMLHENADRIDAVTVSTPDHTHAVVAMTAMKLNKHVFVQKPLTRTVAEARLLLKTARERNLITQMGNQGHASEGARLINEWIADGAIGAVREVHVWTNRPIWPQGIPRPKGAPPVPGELDWNLWLGPAAYRPYHPAYVPFSWRGWWAFGSGALGDMGAHLFDQPYWALDLRYPETIHASSTPFTDEAFPVASTVHYEFPARGDMPPVELTWYDGGIMPKRPELMEEGRRMGDWGGGVLFVGEEGMLMCSTYASNPRLVPEKLMRRYKRPPKTIPRSPGIHAEWIEAIKAGKKSTTDFEYSARLTETMLLGNVAIRLQSKNRTLRYDGEKGEFTNMPEANRYLADVWRPGWEPELMGG